MTPNFAYLSQGKLYLHNATHRQEVESDFGRTVQVRSLQMQRQKAWKNKSLNEMAMPEGLRQKLDQAAESIVNIAITSICQVTGGQLIYALSAGDVSGLFAYSPESDREDRIFHNSEFQVQDIDFHAGHNLIVCTKTHRTGISNIATMPRNSIKLQEITEGDSLDLSPRWIPGQRKAIVYQSAGIGRTSDGFVGDRAPFTIEKLDFETEAMSSLAADPKSDLVAPQIGADGMLYYIRRPYKFKPKMGWWQTIKNILLMPARLIYAIFQYFNFFTQMYTGKPMLRTDQNQPIEPKGIKAWGEYLTPDLMKGQSFSEPDAPSLVPATWQLIRQALSGGEAQVLAQGVLSYDLSSDGAIVYTNGSGIYCLQPDGTCQRLLVSSLIESVRTL
jgi:hypothetical protein